MTLIRYCFSAVSMFAFTSSSALCQSGSTSRVVTGAEASRSLRNGPAIQVGAVSTSAIVRTLTAAVGPVASGVQAALRDSLVAIANEPPGNVSDASQRQAILALGIAGNPGEGTAYAGSARALYLIAMRPDNVNGLSALALLAKLQAHDSAEVYLGKIAASGSRFTWVAVNALGRALAHSRGPHTELRKLWEGATVKDAMACETMRFYAWKYDWPPTPQSSCKF